LSQCMFQTLRWYFKHRMTSRPAGSPTNCNTLKYSTSSVESAHLLVPVPFQVHTAWLAAPAFSGILD
jgi:hypothetical protein